MAEGYFIRKGDKTSCGGEVLEGDTRITMFGFAHARAGDRVSCGKDNETYEIVGGVSFMDSHGRLVAGSLDSVSSCPCKATLTPSMTVNSYVSRDTPAPREARAAPQPAPSPAPGNPLSSRPSGPASAAKTATPSFSERPGTACENLWRGYQQRVENVVAPGGKLITDPKARNKAINAAYAQLWRLDHRFQWAGLAAFTNLPSGAAQAIELTLASQCRPVEDGRTIGFGNNPFANLADVERRMAFVLKAAAQFDDLLHSDQRHQLEQSIREIAWGGGLR